MTTGPIDLTILPEEVGCTPARIGTNIELQDYADTINLWDWVADVGVSMIREFHPEMCLRRVPLQPGDLGSVTTPAAFEALRARFRSDLAGAVRWNDYTFAERFNWRGVPDEMIDRAIRLGIEPAVSFWYPPRTFARPLVTDLARTGVPADDQIDWEAAAVAYEYHVAVAWHYASTRKVRLFLMMNEPEFCRGAFHLHPPLDEELGKDWFWKLFRSRDHEDLRNRFFSAVAAQYAVVARVARCAIDDVGEILKSRGYGAGLRLAGPASAKWPPFWDVARDCFDVLDYHQYSPEPEAFPERYRAADARARQLRSSPGRPAAIGMSEFNRIAGECEWRDSYFVPENGMAFADTCLAILGSATPRGLPLEYACLYLLTAPGTHRNYKSLLYGDMNLWDWSGRDAALWGRGPEWYPTAEEAQLRFPTFAYHVLRMVTRAVRGGRSCPVIGSLVTTWDGSKAPPLHDRLRVLALRNGNDLHVFVLNRGGEPCGPVRMDVAACGSVWRSVTIRETSLRHRDALRRIVAPAPERVEWAVPGNSLTQFTFTQASPADIRTLELREETFTPGGCAGLNLLQTTRLRAVARMADGRERDISDLWVEWESQCPDALRVEQTGLAQYLRHRPGPCMVTVRVPGTSLEARARIVLNG